MPLVQNTQLGPLEYSSGDTIAFPFGIPGFDQEHEFVLVHSVAHQPLLFLQSTRTPELSFVTLPVAQIDPGYHLELTSDDSAALDHGEYLVLAILTAAENCPVTANMLAPVVINLTTRVALQAVRSDSRYSHCHVLGEPVCS